MFDWKKAVRKFARARGYDFVKGPNLHSFLAAHGVGLVIDVGANDGGYGRYLRRWGYRGAIHSFEPNEEALARLSALAPKGERLWKIQHTAVGDRDGLMTLNISDDDRFSSFKPLAANAHEFDPAAAVVRQDQVQVTRLDNFVDFWRSGAPPPMSLGMAFLKVDVQGFEREVLDGAPRLLDLCVGVQLEVPVEQLYDGVWSLEEAIADMRRRGFVVAQMTPTNPSHQHAASAFEFDTIFRRAAP